MPQLNLPTIESHFWSFYNNEKYSDITFKSDAQKFHSHSLILIARAPQFYEKFVKDKRATDIELPEYFGSATSFREFLKFVYFQNCKLSLDNYSDLVRLSSDFNLEKLSTECFAFLKFSLSIEKACELLQKAVDGNYISHIEFVVDFIKVYYNAVLQSQSFLDIDVIALKYILNIEGVETGDELDVFNAVVKWCEKAVLKTPDNNTGDETIKGDAMRTVLDELIYFIRFPMMTNSEFILLILKYKGLLSNDEIVGIYLERNSQTKNRFGFRATSRFSNPIPKTKEDKLPPIKYASELQLSKPRHEVTLIKGGYSIAPGIPESMTMRFKASEAVAIIGALINGSQYRNVKVTAHLFNENDRKLAEGKTVVTSGQTATIYFDNVILTNINAFYKISLSYEEFSKLENVKHFDMLEVPFTKIVNYVEYTFTELSSMIIELYVK